MRGLRASDEAEFFRAHALLLAGEGETLEWDERLGGFAGLIERQRKNAAGEELPAGFVPYTTLYGFVGDRLVGRLGIRHVLNGFLSERGGHIGYVVLAPYRRQGYAGRMLGLSLPVCRELGIARALITCDDKNEGSWRAIERHGGVLERVTRRPQDPGPFRRYWIELGGPPAARP